MQLPTGKVALFYLARGAGDKPLEDISRFVRGYQSYPAGIIHSLVVVFKGFASAQALEGARDIFTVVSFDEFHTGDESFDLGAYADAILNTQCDRACFLNTASEPVALNWLRKLNTALDLPGVGVAAATGSFEAGVGGESFPNVHVRTNAFMLRAPLARRILGRMEIRGKRDAHLAEHGPDGLTRQVVSRGLSAVVVGANGRAYSPEWWIGSRTFRQGDQANLLVADNQTREWDSLAWPKRKATYEATWGAGGAPSELFGPARS